MAAIQARRAGLRSALGENVIRSTLFEVRPVSDGFAFVGAGHGHGVGMSQWGAEAMARRGDTVGS
jgi:stage II sporulation protein D